jgi:UDP-2,4-diacetamido-2,4,6-trideoxy-beta-L-altropyranose hydrolase
MKRYIQADCSNNMKVLIRTDSSVEIGSGHLMRCLTLADQLRGKGSSVAFACRDLPGGLFDLLQAHGYLCVRLSPAAPGCGAQEEDAMATLEAARKLFPDGLDWLVVDHYELDAIWERMLRPHVSKLMVIDDLANRQHDCDLLLDQNYYRDMDRRYRMLVPQQCVTLLGPAYVLLRPEFADARKRLRLRDGTVRRILVFLGGSDPTNQTQKVVEALTLIDRPDIGVDVVVGAGNPNRDTIQALCNQLPNVAFHSQVSNMADLIHNADLGVGAGGATMWERYCLGLPTITVVSAANQERTTEDVAELGAIEYLGWSTQLRPEDYARAITGMLEDPQRVKRIGEAALRVVQAEGEGLQDAMYRIIQKAEISHSIPRVVTQ